MTALQHVSAAVSLALLFVSPTFAADPPDISGTWTWSWKDAAGRTHRHVLEVEGKGSRLAARERANDLEPVKASAIKLNGTKIQLTVVRGDHRAEYSGVVVEGNTINGRVTVEQDGTTNDYPWKATRETAPR